MTRPTTPAHDERAAPARVDPAVARAVLHGLGASPKRLPPWLLYDAEGSRLYERITELAEYYPTRTEQAIFERHARAIVAHALAGTAGPALVVELGAGTAKKTVVLLEALDALAPGSTYVPVDVSASALVEAAARVDACAAGVLVEPLVATHERALDALAGRPGPKVALFIGSSIGNYPDDEAAALLARIAACLGPCGALVLGTDLKKSPAVLVPAYDDGEGVTAAFNLNLLTRINRELGADFAVANFRHVALWNEAASQIEMHLESTFAQRVVVRALDRSFTFAAGERMHTESSIKYDCARVDRLLARAHFVRERTFEDERGWFALHVARAR